MVRILKFGNKYPLFTSVASSVTLAIKATEAQTMLILLFGSIISTLVAIIIMLKSPYSMREYGVCMPIDLSKIGNVIFIFCCLYLNKN